MNGCRSFIVDLINIYIYDKTIYFFIKNKLFQYVYTKRKNKHPSRKKWATILKNQQNV